MSDAPAPGAVRGLRLFRTDENVREIEALAELLGGRAGLGVLDDLKFSARRSLVGRLLGRRVSAALTWNRHDRRDPRWWPQGLTTSAGASATSRSLANRRILAATWYSKSIGGHGHGSRVSFLDLDTMRYRHVLLVIPELDVDGSLQLRSVDIHAGGIAWVGPWLHIAATTQGFVSARVDDIMRIPGDDDAEPDALNVSGGAVSAFSHRYILPVRFAHQARTDTGHRKLRYSFLSVNRDSDPPTLLAGEYGTDRAISRLAHFPLQPRGLLVTGSDGWSDPASLDLGGLARMQGAVRVDGTYYISVSRSGLFPGSVYVGRPGRFRHHWLAVPPGPEDLTHWPDTDEIWTLTEHPHRRWLVALDRSRL